MGQQNLPDQPEWLKNHKPPPGDERGNPNWKKGGPSPNPSGRPAEHGVAKVKLASQIIDNATDILDVMIKKAKEGDSSAAQLVLSRIMAPLKASGERVRFSFDPSLPLSGTSLTEPRQGLPEDDFFNDYPHRALTKTGSPAHQMRRTELLGPTWGRTFPFFDASGIQAVTLNGPLYTANNRF